MRITVMGALILIGGVLLLALVVHILEPGSNNDGKGNDEPTSPK
jgi:hypothetical protein